MDLTLQETCCLHEAVKDRLPLPRKTLIKTVHRVFEKSWIPDRTTGFAIIEHSSKNLDILPMAFCVQTQRYNSLSRGNLSKSESSDESKEIQLQYDKIVNSEEGKELILKIRDSLFEIRIDKIIELTDIEETYDLGSSHEIVDALFHMNPIQLDYLRKKSKGKVKDEMFNDGAWVLEKIRNRDWSPSEKEEFLFAVKEQLNPVPRNSLTNILSKNSEPEHKIESQVVTVPFSFVSSLCLEFIDDQIEWQNKLKLNLLHIGYRLSFAGEWPWIDNNLPDLDELIRDYDLNKISTNFVRDAIILSVIQLKSIENLGRKRIKEYFDLVIDGKDHDQDILQSLEFNRDNFILRGKKQLDKLRLHHEKAVSPFLKGLIDYLIATKLQHNEDERIERMMSALNIFIGVDPIRFDNTLFALITGQTDSYDNNDNPIRKVEVSSYDNSISRLTQVISFMNNNSKDVKYLTSRVLSDISQYIMMRISKHRHRTTESDDAHLSLYNPELNEFKTDLRQIKEFEEELIKLLKNHIDNEIISSQLRNIIELSLIIKCTILNQSKPDLTINYIHEATKNISDDVHSPITTLSNRYTFELEDCTRILDRFGSFILHLAEDHIDDRARKQILEIKEQEIENLRKQTINRFESSIYSYLLEVVKDCKLQFRKDWIIIFRDSAIIKMQTLVDEGEDRTQTEAIFALVLRYSNGLLPPGLGIYDWPHEEYDLITKLLIDATSDLYRLDIENIGYMKMIDYMINLLKYRIENVLEALQNDPLNENYNFEPKEVILKLERNFDTLELLRKDFFELGFYERFW